MAACHDCNRPYGDEHGFPDLVVPHYIWREISPTGDEGGLLCPSCICKRLHDAGKRDIPAAFTSGPIRSVDEHVLGMMCDMERMRECRERSE